MSEFRIESGWLVRDVNEHTCGGSGTEWPYAHEPGCGTIPELRLDDLPGWPGAEVERLRAIEAGVEALAESFEEDVDWSSGRGDYGDNAAYEACARRARALLNPTEGETDD